ncbi:hypothetical protein ACH5RR_037799 [Cinchona calisaya]|uniref:PRA1 family protein n=1 Tax=Cinchona calisaya TaxID=153742 RepID=A0ABD2YBY6_9GENT
MATSSTSPPETKPLISPAPTVEVSRAASPPRKTPPIDTSTYLGTPPRHYPIRLDLGTYSITVVGFCDCNVLIRSASLSVVLFQYIWYLSSRHSPYRCVGGFAKSVVDVVTVSIAMALRLFLGFNIHHLNMLIGSTIVLHAFVRFMHVADDITIWDALLGILMQILIYTMPGDVYMSAAICLAFLGLILYRYASYSAPAMPVIEVKMTELQSC